MTERAAEHGTFAVERTYNGASPARTFAAWADPQAKQIWLDDPDFAETGSDPYELDFRLGGHERFGSKAPDGITYTYDAVYYDIVPEQRIIYCYEMYADEARISVSVVTVEFAAAGTGTRLLYTEQGAFLDGHDVPGERQEGMTGLLDNLGRLLAKEA
jgi:uncharacterized protein YndB with AHSA1/START domain